MFDFRESRATRLPIYTPHGQRKFSEIIFIVLQKYQKLLRLDCFHGCTPSVELGSDAWRDFATEEWTMGENNFESVKEGDLSKIKSFKLRNNGAFTCNGRIQWYDNHKKTKHWTDGASAMPINAGESLWASPEKFKIPSSAYIQLHIPITFGDERSTGKWFIYDSSSDYFYEFDITGTTWDSDVHNDGRKRL